MNSCGIWFVALFCVIGSMALAQDPENPLPSPQRVKSKSNIVGEEFHREYERRVEHGVKLTEEEIERRKKDADRAREILSQKVEQLYAVQLNQNNTLRQWMDKVDTYRASLRDFMHGNLLQSAGNLARYEDLRSRRTSVHDVIYQQLLWEQPSNQYPQLLEPMQKILAETKEFALDLAVQKWEADKFLFH